MIVLQSTPQKLPTLDSTSELSPPFIAAQGLEEKQLSSDAHSSPRGQGVLFSQFCACCSYVFPQKLVFTVGNVDGDEEAAEADGDEVDDTGDDVMASSSLLSALGSSVGNLDEVVNVEEEDDGDVDCVTSSSLSVFGCIEGDFDDNTVGGVDCVTCSSISAFGCSEEIGCVDQYDMDQLLIIQKMHSDKLKHKQTYFRTRSFG